MSTTRQNLRQTWRRWLRDTVEGMALMGAAEQTRLSWAKPVNAVEDMPTSYLDYLNANLPDLNACLPAVLTPTFRGFLRRENEKLVIIHAKHLYILEQTTSELLPTVFPILETNAIEAGAILLKAWLDHGRRPPRLRPRAPDLRMGQTRSEPMLFRWGQTSLLHSVRSRKV